MADSISNRDDVIDSRDVIKRIDELESEIEGAYDEAQGEDLTFMPIVEWMEQADCPVADEIAELETLKTLAKEAEGYSDWNHGVALIRDSHFKSYAQELAEDLHDKTLGNAQWPFNCVDWDKAATELQQDYTSVDFDGVDYWIH